jgi:radical SAM/Cys-rich protein
MQLSPSLREATEFPTIRRAHLETLQANMGYLCNQQCLHCHVNAGPDRTQEVMGGTVIDQVIAFLKQSGVKALDLTGGAPELNRHFKRLVRAARAMGIAVIDRCNLTVLEEPGQEGLANFLAENQVEVVASLPCYLEENVSQQRGNGVFAVSIRSLQRLNRLGYGQEGSPLLLNLVFNPLGPDLPPPQKALEDTFREELRKRYGIVFHSLFTLVNMPIQRFGRRLIAEGYLDSYFQLLQAAHREDNLDTVMCRFLISVDWRGIVYDCDFNQMLGRPLQIAGKGHPTLQDLIGIDLEGFPIVTGDHCFGCTAGQGSSCGGALS